MQNCFKCNRLGHNPGDCPNPKPWSDYSRTSFAHCVGCIGSSRPTVTKTLEINTNAQKTCSSPPETVTYVRVSPLAAGGVASPGASQESATIPKNLNLIAGNAGNTGNWVKIVGRVKAQWFWVIGERRSRCIDLAQNCLFKGIPVTIRSLIRRACFFSLGILSILRSGEVNIFFFGHENIFFFEGNIKNLGFCFGSFENYYDAMSTVNLNGKTLYGEELTVGEANGSNSKKWQEKEQRASMEC